MSAFKSVLPQGTWYIHDLSRNGTHVGTDMLGKDVKRELKGGEEITLSAPTAAAPAAIHVKYDF